LLLPLHGLLLALLSLSPILLQVACAQHSACLSFIQLIFLEEQTFVTKTTQRLSPLCWIPQKAISTARI
jgi:hypothetical protein